jgi:hypothetical protein
VAPKYRATSDDALCLTFVGMVLWVSAANVGSVYVDLCWRHGSIMICVSGIEVPQKLLDISMRLLVAKYAHFLTSQVAVHVMVGGVPG